MSPLIAPVAPIAFMLVLAVAFRGATGRGDDRAPTPRLIQGKVEEET
jgi:hypothetical protein